MTASGAGRFAACAGGRAGVEQGRTGNINQASNNCGVRQRQQAARTPNAGAQFVGSIRQATEQD